MSGSPVAGLPGVRADRDSAFRRVLMGSLAYFLPGGRVLSGASARDPLNTGDVDVLRAGLLMGMVTATGEFAPSVIGTLGVAYAETATQMNILHDAEAAEITRRLGASGTFKITGPQVANGRVRTKTVTYSAVGSGTGVDEVQTFTPDAAATAGTYRIKLSKADGTFVWTAAIAWNATLAVCQAAITLALGAVAGWVASTAGSAAPFSAGPIALVLTGSGTGYTVQALAMCEVEITSLTGVTTMTSVETTKGVPVASTVTVTATGLGATNEVQTLTLNAAMTAGTLTFGLPLLDGTISWVRATWDTDWATTMAAWNVLSDAATGVTGGIVMTGTATVPILTFSGGAYAGREHPETLVDFTGVTGPATVVFTRVSGNSEGFAAGSLIQPIDGSETIRGLLPDGPGIKVTDQDSTSLDVPLPKLLVGGAVTADQIINYPTDTSLQTYIKAALRATGMGWLFNDDFAI